MPFPSVTYTFSNGTTADATQVSQNFTDLINGASDGTKNYSISALTAGGATILNAAVTLGASSVNNIVFNGSLASSIPIGTTNTYDIGSATLGLRALYFGANSQTVKLAGSASMSATWTFTLPVSAGTNTYVMQTDGSGVGSWVSKTQLTVLAKTANYTVLVSDDVLLGSASGGSFTFTLPAANAAGASGKKFIFKRTDNTPANSITISRAGADTIEGATTILQYTQYDEVHLMSDGTSVWYIVARVVPNSTITLCSPNGAGSTNIDIRRFTTTQASVGGDITYADSATLGASFTINVAGRYAMRWTDACSTGFFYQGFSLNSAQCATGIQSITNTTILAWTTALAGGNPNCVSTVAYLAVGDVVRCHFGGNAPDATTANYGVSITRVG